MLWIGVMSGENKQSTLQRRLLMTAGKIAFLLTFLTPIFLEKFYLIGIKLQQNVEENREISQYQHRKPHSFALPGQNLDGNS